MAFSGAGLGTELDPYVITTVSQLQEMKNERSAYYVLGNDIDASDTINWNTGKGFNPIGEASWVPFQGNFDGNGFTISDLYINRTTDNCSLFGSTRDNIFIRNVTIKDAYISGGHRTTGFISSAGAMEIITEVIIENCVIIATGDAAGVVGAFSGVTLVSKLAVIGGSITGVGQVASICIEGLPNQCFSSASLIQTGTLETNKCAGIVCLLGYTTIADNIFVGSINAQGGMVAGIVAYMVGGTLTRNISAPSSQNKGNGIVWDRPNGASTNNWWDMDSSGILYDPVGTGIPTNVAKDINTYLNAGVSIATYANYVDETWKIDDGIDYPILGFIPVVIPPTIIVTGVLENDSQVFFGHIGIEVTNGFVALVNTSQSVSGQLNVLASVEGEIENAGQAFVSSGVVFAAVTSNIENSSQEVNASVTSLIVGNGVLENSPQVFYAYSGFLLTVEVILENQPQTFASVVGGLVSVSGVLENGGQNIIIDAELVERVAASLENDSQLITGQASLHIGVIGAIINAVQAIEGHGDIPIQINSSIENAPQIFTATSRPSVNLEVAITNGPQDFVSVVGVLVSVAVNIQNTSQAFLASGNDEIGVSISLTNASQELTGTIILPDLNISGTLTNAPQSFFTEVGLLLVVSAYIENNPQIFSATTHPIELNVFVGNKKVIALYYQNQSVTQLQFNP